MGCKLRWEEERANRYNKEQEEALLPDETRKKYEDLDDEEKLELVHQEAKDKQVYGQDRKTINLSKFRATDS